jgi:hypothetical protein
MISKRELQILSTAFEAGRDETGSRRVQDMVRAEARRVERAFAELSHEITVTFTDDDPYQSFEELRQDVTVNRRMRVFKGGSDTPLWDPLTNWKARAVHDWDHIVSSSDFSVEGEAATYRRGAARMPGLAPLYLSEIVLQAALQTYTGEFAPTQKLVLPSEHVIRIANSLRGPGDRRRQAPAAMVWYAAGLLKVMSVPDLMVHLGAAGYDWESALVIADAAHMLDGRKL